MTRGAMVGACVEAMLDRIPPVADRDPMGQHHATLTYGHRLELVTMSGDAAR